MANLTNTIIEAAIIGFEAQKQTIDAQIAELSAMLTGTPKAHDAAPATGMIPAAHQAGARHPR